jgi:hypothetical protein
VLTSLCLSAAGAGGPLPGLAAPASAPAASRPTSTPAGAAAEAATQAAQKLAQDAQAKAREMLANLDDSFHVVIRPPFVVLGDFAAADLERLTAGSVIDPANAMWKCYFEKRPDAVITVLLLKDADGFAKWAKKLFNDTDLPHYGYYKPDARALVMNISTGTGTLVHELTHALIVYDFPDVPPWFNEGFASLHEQSQVRPDTIIGQPNWRLPALQKAIAAKELRSLRELVTAGDFYGKLRDLNYAQARYFVMYMQAKSLLRDFYREYRDHHAGDDSAVKAIEKVFGAKLDQIEPKFLEWVMTLKIES